MDLPGKVIFDPLPRDLNGDGKSDLLLWLRPEEDEIGFSLFVAVMK